MNCSEAAVHSHPFSKIYKENTADRTLLLEKSDWQSRAAILYKNDTTKNVFLEIFQNLSGHLDIIISRGK